MRTLSLDRDGFNLSGKKQILMVGSLFYFRIPRTQWRDRMEKLKQAGYHAMDVYFPWNYHELSKDVWDFTGERDVSAFLDLAEEVGLYVVARPGPYICSEWDGGALPAYLFTGAIRIRDYDEEYLARVKEWYDRILPILNAHSYIESFGAADEPSKKRGGASSGSGCVIAVQLENEYDFFDDCENPDAYIDALRDMALEQGIKVPLFACSGQSGIERAGGLRVYPAMNFYPGNDDTTFWQRLLGYYNWLYERGFALLVTETNRDHQFLRLLMLCGAKLLGPYNQVGGTNFGFTSSINNWGDPVSFITSDYTFKSMISPSGEINRERMLRARLLRRVIDLFSDIPEARPIRVDYNDIVNEKAEATDRINDTDEVFIAALKLPKGGILSGGYNYGERARAISGGDGAIVTLNSHEYVFWMRDISLARWGMDGTIDFSTATLVEAGEGRLVFAAERQSDVIINGTSISFSGKRVDCYVEELSITILPWEEAVDCNSDIAFEQSESFDCEWNALPPSNLSDSLSGDIALGAEDWRLEHYGILRGYGLYGADVDFADSVGLLFTEASDILRVWIDDGYKGHFLPKGDSFYLPLKSSECEGVKRLEALAEIWGHSNFDDHRAPSLRIKSLRGIKSIINVTDITQISIWENTDSKGAPIYTSLGNWQTTKNPVSGIYKATLNLRGGEISMLYFENTQATIEVYVNSVFAGEANEFKQWLDITDIATIGGPISIECRTTKRDFTVDCGKAILYQGKRINKGTLTPISEKELLRHFDSQKEKLQSQTICKFPLSLPSGSSAWLYADMPPESCELELSGTGIKATIFRGERMTGRIWLANETGPKMTGGRTNTAYLPASFDNPTRILLESVSKNSVLQSIKTRTVGTYEP